MYEYFGKNLLQICILKNNAFNKYILRDTPFKTYFNTRSLKLILIDNPLIRDNDDDDRRESENPSEC